MISYLDRHAGLILALALIGLILWMSGCAAEPPPRPGTAQADAAGQQARADAAGSLADQADRDQAEAAGRAAAADAAAQADPTPAKIAAAVAARLDAVRAEATAQAHHAAEARLRAAAAQAQAAAARERADELAAQDYRSWVRLCRWVGGAGIVLGAVLGLLIAWASKSLRLAVPVGGSIAAVGALVIALGPATAWLPWAVLAAVVVGLVWWACAHRLAERASAARKALAMAACRTIDAVEGGISEVQDEAKAGLRAAAQAARLHDEIAAARGVDRQWRAA
jgi:hypothetical protein